MAADRPPAPLARSEREKVPPEEELALIHSHSKPLGSDGVPQQISTEGARVGASLVMGGASVASVHSTG